MKTKDFIRKYNPCAEGAEFALEYDTMAEVWENCPRFDWLIWICAKMNIKHDKQCRLFAVWCIRNTKVSEDKTTWDLLGDERSRNAVVVAERFANGEATAEDLRVAYDAANYAVAAVARSNASLVAHYVAVAVACPNASLAMHEACSSEPATQFRLMIPNPFNP